ncbi:MAG: hypothetical protein ACRBFS_01375 [Aureispira sp.]
MDDILDEKKTIKKTVKENKITPFLITGLFVIFICIFFTITCSLELAKNGSKGPLTVILITPFITAITIIVLFIERKIVTDKNIHLIIRIEALILFMPLLFCIYIAIHWFSRLM